MNATDNAKSAKPDKPGSAKYRPVIVAAGALALLGLTIVALGFVNDRRGRAETETLRGKLCGPLREDLLTALERVGTEAANAESGKQAWVILDGMVNRDSDTQAHVRILQKTDQGWRELRNWSHESVWIDATPWLELMHETDCGGELHDGTVRAARRVRRNDVELVLIAERKRS